MIIEENNKSALQPELPERPESDAADMPLAKRFHLSVRVKSLIVLSTLILYTCIIAVFGFYEKNQLMRDFEKIERSLELDGMLKDVDAAAFHTVMGVFINIDSFDRNAGLQRILVHMQSLRAKQQGLKDKFPEVDIDLADVNQSLEAATADASKENMNKLIVQLVKIKNDFTNLAERTRSERARMSDQYRTKTDSVAMTMLILGMFGLVLLGTIAGLFFKQLTEDLKLLQRRALEIVNGYRGEPMPVRRHDEVGQLMHAVNGMVSVLDRREKELLLERQKYFHQEKMAAIGALAAGVAHEIGNPIAAICGIAQDMAEQQTHELGSCSNENCGACRPDLILQQAQRLAAITREISEFASPQPLESQFLSLNAQLRSSSSLLRYDKRSQSMDLRLKLDPQLPAVYGVGDQITQLIMNLLINAMDALESVVDRPRIITISTAAEEGRVCLTVADNGPGMDEDVRQKAFDAFYTTKPAGKGTGLGLSLCHSIMEKHGGSIEIDSAPGTGIARSISTATCLDTVPKYSRLTC